MNQQTHVSFNAETLPPGRALEAIYATAYTMLEAGRLKDATHAFRVMVRFAPTDERSWLGLARCHEELGEDDVAAEIYGAGSVVIAGGSARCLVALSRLERRSGDATTANGRLDDALVVAEASGDGELVALIEQERSAS